MRDAAKAYELLPSAMDGESSFFGRIRTVGALKITPTSRELPLIDWKRNMSERKEVREPL